MTLGCPPALPSALPSRCSISVTLSDTLVLKINDFRGGDLSALVLELSRMARAEGRRSSVVCQGKSLPWDAAGVWGSGGVEIKQLSTNADHESVQRSKNQH